MVDTCHSAFIAGDVCERPGPAEVQTALTEVFSGELEGRPVRNGRSAQEIS
jgi:hypothetical protein